MAAKRKYFTEEEYRIAHNDSCRKYYHSHREKEIARKTAWNQANPGNQKKYDKKYREHNREKCQGKSKRWLLAHPGYSKNRVLGYRTSVFNYYGKICACCGEDKMEFLSIDHINNDGAKHRREIGRAPIYRWLIKNNFPPGFQTLCHNCNQAKYIYGQCPHKGEKFGTLTITDTVKEWKK